MWTPARRLAGALTAAPVSPSPTGVPDGPFVLGLGDSVPGAGGPCQRDPGCRSYVLVLADLATQALGHPVAAVNRARNDDVTSESLLADVRGNPRVRELVTKASLVVIQVGNNDWQGPCVFGNAAPCLEEGRRKVVARVGSILEEVVGLRGSPAGVRLVTYANTLTEDHPADGWGYEDTAANEEELAAVFDTAIRRLDAGLCGQAEAHGVRCVDLLPAVNGPQGTQPSHLGGIHPTRVGHETIAGVVAAAGFDDVR